MKQEHRHSQDGQPRFQDGKSGLSHDRILIRLVNYTQIILAFMAIGGGLGGAWWFSVQIVRFIDKTNMLSQQMSIVQQQQSRFEQLLVGRRPTRHDDDNR